MLILLGFGVIHSLIYTADFLAMYALLSLFLIISRKLSDWVLLIFTAILLIQPFYMVRLIISLNQPDVSLFFNPLGGFWRPLYPLMQQDSLLELVKRKYTFWLESYAPMVLGTRSLLSNDRTLYSWNVSSQTKNLHRCII